MVHLERIKSAEEQAKEAKDIAMSVKDDMHKISASIDSMSSNFSDLKDTVKNSMIQISNTFEKMSNMHSDLQVLTHDSRVKDNHNREEHSRIEGRLNEHEERTEKLIKMVGDRMDTAKIEETHLTASRIDTWIRLIGKTVFVAIILAIMSLIITNGK
jgi:predicted RNase H-like nuclease (RuvC/YqgF family)